MRELCNAFVRQRQRPTVPRMMQRYEIVSRLVPKMTNQNRSKTLFEPRAFEDLVALAAYARG